MYQAHKRKVHMGMVHNYYCEICKKGFHEKAWYQHKKIHTTGEEPAKETIQCKICDKTLGKRSYLSHIKLMHSETNLSVNCQICDKKMKNSFSLRAHMKTHNRDKDLQCDQCTFSTHRLESLKIHQKRAHVYANYEDRPYACAQEGCQFRHVTQADLNKHFEEKHGNRVLTCEKCGFQTKSPATLRGHTQRMHSDAFNYLCTICSKPFFTSENVLRHAITIHSDLKPYGCAYCDIHTNHRELVRRHIKAVHTGSKLSVIFKKTKEVLELESKAVRKEKTLKSNSISSSAKALSLKNIKTTKISAKENLYEYIPDHELTFENSELPPSDLQVLSNF